MSDRSMKTVPFTRMGSKNVISILVLVCTAGCSVLQTTFESHKPLPECMKFVEIPEGDFLMGDFSGDDDELPVHEVHIKKFSLMTTEVTQEMWMELMWYNPSKFSGKGLPVEQVTWKEAQEFIVKLNRRDPGKNYRLPSEAEWEYACRAGKSLSEFSGNEDSIIMRTVWSSHNSEEHTHPVRSKLPNDWGLFEMQGNVWEWCEDSFHKNYANAPDDGSPWVSAEATERILRGGSWFSEGRLCRATNRYKYNQAESFSAVGFRIACDSRL